MNFVVNTCLGCVWQRHFTPTKTMELGVAPPFFEQIRSGPAGAGCVWLKKFGAELVFLSGAE
jgi:hypothetical protein